MMTDPQLASTTVTSPSITRDEIENAIRNSRNNKPAGPDEIPSEILKLLDKAFNSRYETGHYPNQWLRSTCIPLPIKTNARKCEDHRLISFEKIS